MKTTARIIFIITLILCLSLGTFISTAAATPTSTEVTRIYGQNRYETATKIADALADRLNLNFSAGDKFDNVVLASGNNYPDALSGAPLACSLNAPILLLDKTPEDSQVTLNYIDAHVRKSGKVILLGGTGVIPESFKNQLIKMEFYSDNIIQYGGRNRDETSLIIAKAIGSTPTYITLVSDANFYDALTTAPLCSYDLSPIILVSPSGITAEQKEYLDEAVKKKIEIYEFGEIEYTTAGTDIKNNYPDTKIIETFGLDRYGSNSVWAMLPFFLTNPVPAPIIYLATGEDYPDALAGAILASWRIKGYLPGYILLTKPNKLPSSTILILNHMAYYAKLPSVSVDDNKTKLDPIVYPEVIVFGGPGAVSDSVVSQVQQILNSPGEPVE